MAIPRLFNSNLPINVIAALFISLLLTACSTEENYTGGAGGGAPQGASQNVTLAWVAPVEREDGTPISMAEIAARLRKGKNK